MKELILNKIKESGLIPVIRAENSTQAHKTISALIQGGVKAIEITFTVPYAQDIIREVASQFQDKDILIGAGTVLDPETARIAILSGAKFIVSPGINLDTIKLCNRYRVPIITGIMTPTEAITAMEAGADILKVFPAGLFGPKIIQDLSAPLPQAQFIPTGGINVSNAQDWIRAGAVALGAGGSLIKGDYNEIIATTRQFIDEIRKARAEG